LEVSAGAIRGCDSIRIARPVIANLVANAILYSPKDRGADPRGRQRDPVLLEVRNEGPPIRRKRCALFEAFQRGDGARPGTPTASGSGSSSRSRSSKRTRIDLRASTATDGTTFTSGGRARARDLTFADRVCRPAIFGAVLSTLVLPFRKS